MKVLEYKRGEEDHQAEQHKIVFYREVHSITERMLESAKRGDWDMLTSQEESRQNLIKRAFGQRNNRDIEDAAGERQADLIRGILALDHQTRALLRKKMCDVSRHFDREKKITKAYGLQ